ncbi:tetratricopeptide repeat protein [Thiohalocapsa marina]|uniref:Tetratricopeptide repeat protein n=1 Tax=Thiohalocapsa marina TaxID=424902 RepID=A0A5M8FT42_9GAMM|nr:winged helix-turn-helix domain-containing protein [Thiohalocapsa marina]KAA6186973.1 tetratricopeptide repeat protein [Thiohalocapsa marina]
MSDPDAFQLGEWTVQPSLSRIVRGEPRTRPETGSEVRPEIRIEPRYMDLLVYLAQASGRVVSAEEILERVWAGQVVGEHSVYQAIARLRKALGDDSSQPRYIETVPKRGYRLIARQSASQSASQNAGRESAATPAPGEGADLPPPSRELNPGDRPPEERRSGARLGSWSGPLSGGARAWRARVRAHRRWIVPLALSVTLVCVALLWLAVRQGAAPEAIRTVAVLPFETLGDDQAYLYFAEGLGTELINALGQLSNPRVVGPVSSFGLPAEGTTPAEAGRLLGADALVSGQVLRADDHLRVFIRILDTRDGRQLWSRSYDRPLSDVYEVQRDIARSVVESLRGGVSDAEMARLTPPAPDILAAYDYYLLGQHYRSTRTEEGLRRALELYQQAAGTDPNYAPAYRGLGLSYLLLSYYGNLPLAQSQQLARPALDKALELAPDDAETVAVLGLWRYLRGEYGLAEHQLEQALAQRPDDAEAWVWLGLAMQRQGRLRDALASLEQARRLEPLSVLVAVDHARALGRSGERARALSELQALVGGSRATPQLERNLADLALESGDLAGAYRWADSALGQGERESASMAMMALTLACVGEADRALRWAERTLAKEFPSQSARDRLEILYQVLGDVAGLKGLVEIERAALSVDQSPDLEWRRVEALSGLSALLDGRPGEAARALEKALGGRTDAVVASDYDLVYLGSLAHAYRQSGDPRRAAQWLDRARQRLDELRAQGWDSQWLHYAAVRLTLLQEGVDAALVELEQWTSGWAVAAGLLANDPVLEPLRKDPRFPALHEALRAEEQAAWNQIKGQRSAGNAVRPWPCPQGATYSPRPTLVQTGGRRLKRWPTMNGSSASTWRSITRLSARPSRTRLRQHGVRMARVEKDR